MTPNTYNVPRPISAFRVGQRVVTAKCEHGYIAIRDHLWVSGGRLVVVLDNGGVVKARPRC